ncbi:DUF2249 domain-containing protein [Noviherbaspirillum sp. UKPF54]|uniref:DUF2249 domain-containing protein n=1 Tax=Noviherbaspirillum sp. UKPF54 TaxID=2601898 RepID=UPI0011B1BC2B|nr:DUF2249 domain-containing protein [Noviherbaspirillum sp. UKPF54]QDZ28029.1 DUF2249 domain-containing protein [Noviherbaspirillum sp. UKPF54]
MTQSDDEIALDVCWLEPPEPMERILDALSTMPPDKRLRVLIHREPIPLYRILGNNGYAYRTQSRDDHLYEILIWQK